MTAHGEPVLMTSIEGRTATLWLNRPEKRNAVTFTMWEELPAVLDEVAATEARVLIVRGAGGHFCAGADITGLGARLADGGVAGGYREVNAIAEAALRAFPRPTLAVIEGNCIGGGWQIASACDLRLAASSTLLGITPARLGITYPIEAIRRTVSLVGPAATKRLLFTAELIDADESLRLGFVDRVVDDSELEAAADALCDELAGRSLLTQLATKAVVDALIDDGGDAIDEIVHRYDLLSRDSGDLHEGLAAFGEKRSPQFSWTPERS